MALTQKALREKLREFKVFNPWGLTQLGGGTIYISYRPRESGRGYRCAAWQVIDVRRRKTTDETSPHWMDNGHKTFNVLYDIKAEKPPQLDACKAWVAEKYGVTEWVKGPFGDDYIPKDVYERAIAKAMEAPADDEVEAEQIAIELPKIGDVVQWRLATSGEVVTFIVGSVIQPNDDEPTGWVGGHSLSCPGSYLIKRDDGWWVR